MLDQPDMKPKATALAELPSRLHHHAFVVKDQEANRHFFEDILGLPLVATWCERVFNPELGREVDYCHTFFALADGGALAFFQFADAELYERARPIFPPAPHYQHIALKVERAGYDEIEQRLTSAAMPHREVDHGYCRSLYVKSPDGLIVEFTVDPENVEAIAAMRRADAHQALARWLAGDRRPNNADRPH
jgi:glyoxylase I family protein